MFNTDEDEIVTVPAGFRRMLFEGCEMPEAEDLEEGRGVGRNILKKFGQRDDDDNFEDAVNAANDGDEETVKDYLMSTVRANISKPEHRKCYWVRMEELEKLINKFYKWNNKKPKRYNAFFKIAEDMLDHMKRVHKSCQDKYDAIDKLKKGVFKIGKLAGCAAEAYENNPIFGRTHRIRISERQRQSERGSHSRRILRRNPRYGRRSATDKCGE